MEQTIINNHKVTIYHNYNETQLFITNPEGEQIFAHKVSGDAMEWARDIIPGAREVAAPAAVIHKTNDGRRIPVTELMNDHLLSILPKVRFSTHRFHYIAEAQRRGIMSQSAAA